MRSTSRTAPAEGGPPGLFCKLGGRCNQKTRRVRECESIAPEIRKVMDWADRRSTLGMIMSRATPTTHDAPGRCRGSSFAPSRGSWWRGAL